MRLTDRAIRNLKPRPNQYKLSDGRGMFLLVMPNNARYWRLKYRTGGKEKGVSLGVYPDVSLAEARSRRDEARKLLAKGTDPSEQRQADKREAMGKAANSFEAVAREWHGKQVGTWVPKHADDVFRRLESNLFPDLGGKPISDITALMLLAAARKVESRGAYDLAHRMVSVAGQVFRYAVAAGKCDRDPSGDLRGALTPHKPKHQNAVKPKELPNVLRAIGGYATIGDKQTALARSNKKFSKIVIVKTSDGPFDLRESAFFPTLRFKTLGLEELRALMRDERDVRPG